MIQGSGGRDHMISRGCEQLFGYRRWREVGPIHGPRGGTRRYIDQLECVAGCVASRDVGMMDRREHIRRDHLKIDGGEVASSPKATVVVYSTHTQ